MPFVMQFQRWSQFNTKFHFFESKAPQAPWPPVFCPLNRTQLNDIPWLHSEWITDQHPNILAFEQGYGATGSWPSARGGQTP